MLDKNAESGVALLAVMLGLAVISVLALGMVLVTQSGVRRAHTDIESSQARAFFDAVMLQTVNSLLDENQNSRFRIDGVPQKVDVLGNPVSIIVSNEFGKVDLNAADHDTLARLFLAAGEGPDEAQQVANKIVERRTGGNGINVVAPFRVSSELLQIPGVTEDTYSKILPSITVYSGRARIDQSTAPLLALAAMPNMDVLSAQAIIRGRSEPDEGNQTSEVTNGKLAQGISMVGWAFSVDAEFTLRGRHMHSEAVIRMTGDESKPYLVLWRQDSLE